MTALADHRRRQRQSWLAIVAIAAALVGLATCDDDRDIIRDEGSPAATVTP